MVGGGILFRLDKSQIEVIVPGIIETLIYKHDTKREEKMHKYYLGEHKILDRKFADESKPNNKIVANWCEYISDQHVGYFMGKPVVYSSKNKEYMQEIQDIYDSNDEQKINYEIAEQCSRYGYGVEILYTKENQSGKKEPRFRPLPLIENNIILVFDNSVEENLILAIRYWENEDVLDDSKSLHAYVYSEHINYHFVQKDNEEFFLESEEAHGFSEVPVNYFWNKGSQLKSDFEGIIPLNNSYDALISDDVNESESSTDAILKVWGIDNIPETQEMKEKRLLNFGKVEKEDRSDAEWLIKDINSEWKENQKNRTKKDILDLSKVPDMTDKSFAESSGVALERRILPLENTRSTKERYFKEGLQRRIRMITNILNISKKYDYLDIDIKFQRNLPTDTQTDIANAVALVGTNIASMQTLRKMAHIEDPAYEKELIEHENEEYIRLNVKDDIDESNNGTNKEANTTNGEEVKQA